MSEWAEMADALDRAMGSGHFPDRWSEDEAFSDFYFDDDVSPDDLITMAVVEEWVDLT